MSFVSFTLLALYKQLIGTLAATSVLSNPGRLYIKLNLCPALLAPKLDISSLDVLTNPAELRLMQWATRPAVYNNCFQHLAPKKFYKQGFKRDPCPFLPYLKATSHVLVTVHRNAAEALWLAQAIPALITHQNELRLNPVTSHAAYMLSYKLVVVDVHVVSSM